MLGCIDLHLDLRQHHRQMEKYIDGNECSIRHAVLHSLGRNGVERMAHCNEAVRGEANLYRDGHCELVSVLYTVLRNTDLVYFCRKQKMKSVIVFK